MDIKYKIKWKNRISVQKYFVWQCDLKRWKRRSMQLLEKGTWVMCIQWIYLTTSHYESSTTRENRLIYLDPIILLVQVQFWGLLCSLSASVIICSLESVSIVSIGVIILSQNVLGWGLRWQRHVPVLFAHMVCLIDPHPFLIPYVVDPVQQTLDLVLALLKLLNNSLLNR